MPVETYTAFSDREAPGQLLATLERWRMINDGHHTEKRKWVRHPYLVQPYVSLPLADEEKVVFRAWSRDVSEAGICLLLPRELAPCTNITDSSQIVDVAELVNVEGQVSVGLEFHLGSVIWLSGVVRRLRALRRHTLECGVQFVARETESSFLAN